MQPKPNIGDLVKAVPRPGAKSWARDVVGIYLGKKWVTMPSETSTLAYLIIANDIINRVYANMHTLVIVQACEKVKS